MDEVMSELELLLNKWHAAMRKRDALIEVRQRLQAVPVLAAP